MQNYSRCVEKSKNAPKEWQRDAKSAQDPPRKRSKSTYAPQEKQNLPGPGRLPNAQSFIFPQTPLLLALRGLTSTSIVTTSRFPSPTEASGLKTCKSVWRLA